MIIQNNGGRELQANHNFSLTNESNYFHYSQFLLDGSKILVVGMKEIYQRQELRHRIKPELRLLFQVLQSQAYQKMEDSRRIRQLSLHSLDHPNSRLQRNCAPELPLADGGISGSRIVCVGPIQRRSSEDSRELLNVRSDVSYRRPLIL